MKNKLSSTYRAQIAFEFLSNFLLVLVVITLFANAFSVAQQRIIEQTKKSTLLLELQETSQEFDVYLTSGYLTEKERIQQIEICSETICYKLVNNTLVLEFTDAENTKAMVARVLSYPGVINEPV